jgi:carboxynorspermidine decarboxylase
MEPTILSKRRRTMAIFSGRSPAFVYSSAAIVAAHTSLIGNLGTGPVRVLYATKACSLEPVIRILSQLVNGFAVASPAEARLVVGFQDSCGSVHLTTPGFRAEWFKELANVTHLAFNSLSQWQRAAAIAPQTLSLGVRVNPARSVVTDERYDPCRRYSKLGVSVVDARAWLEHVVGRRPQGIHVHNGCLTTSWMPLLQTVREITARLGPFLSKMDWINFGGGYVWDDTTDFAPLEEAVDLVTDRYGLNVFLEPGAGLVNAAGSLVASVIDVFRSDGKRIAVLDTTVNHLPEVFEYQYEPDVLEHVEGARYEYLLAGCSCLAGDLFGEYSFAEPLEVGSRVTFLNVGAYSLVKAHRFNGIDLPAAYIETEGGHFRSIADHDGDDSFSSTRGESSGTSRAPGADASLSGGRQRVSGD